MHSPHWGTGWTTVAWHLCTLPPSVETMLSHGLNHSCDGMWFIPNFFRVSTCLSCFNHPRCRILQPSTVWYHIFAGHIFLLLEMAGGAGTLPARGQCEGCGWGRLDTSLCSLEKSSWGLGWIGVYKILIGSQCGYMQVVAAFGGQEDVFKTLLAAKSDATCRQ